MTVYVDNAENQYRRMKMCHMLADTLPELMMMADRIGVARKWYQDFNKASCPHFDICKSKRELALEAGAQPVNRTELVQVVRRIKQVAIERKARGENHGW